MIKKIMLTIICILLVSLAFALDADNYCEQGEKVIVCYMDGRISAFVNPIINKVTQDKSEALVLNAELTIIDEDFLKEFDAYVQDADEEELSKIKLQLKDYVSSIKDEVPEVQDDDIQDLLDEKIDFEEFMKRAWR